MNPTTLDQPVAMKPKPPTERKRIPSILDQYTEQLFQMDGEGKTLNDMVAWLKTRDIQTSVNNVSKFLIRRRQQKQIFEQLDGEMGAVDSFLEWQAENPNAPAEAIIDRFKVLALNLSMQKEPTPEMLKLADRLAGTASRVANDRSREDYRMRKLVMEEAKHAEWVKIEQTRALELCLEESKKYPDIADKFRAIFAELKQCQKEGRK